MAALGLALLWGGYSLGIFGYSKIKHASLTFSDVVLPSHRSVYVSAATAWSYTGAKLSPAGQAYEQGQANKALGQSPSSNGNTAPTKGLAH